MSDEEFVVVDVSEGDMALDDYPEGFDTDPTSPGYIAPEWATAAEIEEQRNKEVQE